MKMAAVSTVTALLLCCSFFASADSADACSHYAITNKDFTLPLNHKLQNSERFTWKHKTTTTTDTIYDSRKDKDSKGAFSNGSLILTKVNKESEGEYIPEVFTSNGKAVQNLQKIRLCVIDQVPKPKVTITCPSTSSVRVTCSIKVKDLQLAWFQNEKLLVGKKEQSLTFTAEDVEKDSFRCEVSNKASSLKSDPVTQTCFTSWLFPFGINIWIFVGGGAGVVVLLILIVIIFCIHNRRRKRVQLKDEEELRLGWTNPNQQQREHHHHHHHQQQHNHPPNQHRHHHPQQQQQQPAGHTGPRQHRKKQQHNPRPAAPDPNAQPEPSPRRQGLSLPKVPDSVDDEQPPPLPQPRKKVPKTQRV